MAARPHGMPRLSEAPPLTSLFHAGGELASSLLGMTPFVREAPQPQREQLEAHIDAAHAAGNHELGEHLENSLAGMLRHVYGEGWRAHL